MKTEEIRRELERFTYKPGWTFQVGDHPREGQLLRIEGKMPDSYNEDEMIDLGISSWIPPLPAPVDFWSWLHWRIKRIELHELAEFFKVDGKVLDDPHSDDDPWLATLDG